MGALALITGLPALAGKVLDFLKSPVGIIVLLALAVVGGEVHGRSVIRARWAADKQASIVAAERIDKQAAEAARASAVKQAADAQTRMADARDEIERLRKEVAGRPADRECLVGDDAALFDRLSGSLSGAPTRTAPHR